MRSRLSVLLYLALGAWTLICLAPLYWALITSLKGPADLIYGPRYIPFVDFAPNIDAWHYMLREAGGETWPRLFNSAIISFVATFLSLLSGGLAVYALTRIVRHPWRDALLTGFLASRLLPPILVAVPVYLGVFWAGLLDTHLALVFVYTALNLPVAVWLLLPLFGPHAMEIEEAAQLDGAAHIRILFGIIVPMLAPGLAAAGLLIFVLCWHEYLFAVLLTADRALTLPPFLAGLMSIREQQASSDPDEISRLAAVTLLMIAPLIPCAGFVHRALRKVAGSD